MLLHLLASTVLLAALTAGPAGAASRPVGHRSAAVLDEDFSRLDVGTGRTWGWKTAAYETCTDNPNDFKLDHLTTWSTSTVLGHLSITAAPGRHGRWNTGLLTTGDSCGSGGNGAMIRTGGLLLVHVRMPAADTGSWPGLWTWRDGANEMDVFEWHADAPGTLEFANHVKRPGSFYFYEGPEVGAEQWVWVGARFGADSVAWYVGTDPDHLVCVFADTVGVGPDFASYPVLNLAVDNGGFHSAPPEARPATMEADRLVILQPAPDTLPQPGGVGSVPL
ncbi:beta-glucanase [Kitasatospora sp. KL5]|uniref:beta-glucanase n=1 Tax=Kitasatospora sp. KL5 TaxID=3425125 RepID=UPI003D6F0C45